MPTTILQSAELARNRFVKGEIAAGIAFARNAMEEQQTSPAMAATFEADARDCYETAIKLLSQAESMPLELNAMLDELKERLDFLQSMMMVLSAAA